jgi:long-chain-acyl-CoA dehydrogenase
MERTLFEPEHLLFRESYRSFLEQHVAPNHDRWEEQNLVDRDVWIEAGKNGFLAVEAPEEFGGGGVDDFRYNTIIDEETVRGGYSGLGFALHNDVVAPYLLDLCNDEQKARWLPGFISGELITAIAMTEPGTGSDLQGIKCSTVQRRSSPTASMRTWSSSWPALTPRPARKASACSWWSEGWMVSNAAAISTRSG